MSADKEGKVERKGTEYLESIGFYVIKLIQTTKNGIPDRMAIRKRKGARFAEVIFVEFKAPGEKADALQLRRQYELELYGVKSYIIDNVEYLKTLVQ